MKDDDIIKALATRVAWLYYMEDLTQQEIADRLRLSRVKVTRLLQRARAENIVEVHITNANVPCLTTERQLVAHFNLRDAVVVPTTESRLLQQCLGQAAAMYLERILRSGDMIGVGSGATLSQIPAYLSPNRDLQCVVVELIGGLSRTDRTINPYDCSWRMAAVLGARSEHLHVPAMVEDPAIAQMLLTDIQTRGALEQATRCDIAIVGIGELDSPTRAKMGYISQPMLEQLRRAGAVGDILLRFYDRDGQLVPSGFDDRVLGLTLSQLQQIPLVIGVAGGERKKHAILGALRGQLVDVIICDEATAYAVLEETRNELRATVKSAAQEANHAL